MKTFCFGCNFDKKYQMVLLVYQFLNNAWSFVHHGIIIDTERHTLSTFDLSGNKESMGWEWWRILSESKVVDKIDPDFAEQLEALVQQVVSNQASDKPPRRVTTGGVFDAGTGTWLVLLPAPRRKTRTIVLETSGDRQSFLNDPAAIELAKLLNEFRIERDRHKEKQFAIVI